VTLPNTSGFTAAGILPNRNALLVPADALYSLTANCMLALVERIEFDVV